MLIHEQISGVLEQYDHTAGAWSTAVTLSDHNVISASCRRQVCADGAFAIGGVFSATLSLVCRLPGMTTFQVRGARIRLYSQYDGEPVPQAIGIFYVTAASRVGEIFTIDGQDAIGWLDSSAYNCQDYDLVGGLEKYLLREFPDGHNIQAWLERITPEVAKIAYWQTGIPQLVTWEHYHPERNQDVDYCNADYAYWLYGDNGIADTDTPRDFYRWLSELACGFIYSKPDSGNLSLGQFGQPEYGTAQIGMEDIEADSCDIADYTIQVQRATLVSQLADGRVIKGDAWITVDHSGHIAIRHQIDSNPFLDGHASATAATDMNQMAINLRAATEAYCGGCTVRPFQCRVHQTARFHPGQRVRITWKHYGEASAEVYDSILTGMQWEFRGGWQLWCGGEDSRVMADCMKATKGDKALKEARNRCAAIEKQIGGG